jgi:hypothetical protein
MYPHSHPVIAGALARQRASELAEEVSNRAFEGHDNPKRRLRARRVTQSALVLATVIVALVAAVPAVAGAATATVSGGSSEGDSRHGTGQRHGSAEIAPSVIAATSAVRRGRRTAQS